MNELRKSRALNLIFTNALCEQKNMHDRITKLEYALNTYRRYSGLANLSHCHMCLEICHSQDIYMCDTCYKGYCERCSKLQPLPATLESFICTSCTTNRT